MVLHETDGTFLGVAPGAGITTTDGRIVMPLYVDRKSTVSIYSVDNGDTWHRMTSQPYAENTDEWQWWKRRTAVLWALDGKSALERPLCPFLPTREKAGANAAKPGCTPPSAKKA